MVERASVDVVLSTTEEFAIARSKVEATEHAGHTGNSIDLAAND
jgi:hypothetical protein